MARFLQLTDLHVVGKGMLCSNVLDTRSILRDAVNRLLELRPALDPLDAVLITGDVSDDGSRDSYAFARTHLERLGLPLFLVPGNHDARDPMRAAFAGQEWMPKNGLIDWQAQIGDTQLVGLDSLVEGQGGGQLRGDSLAVLSDVLADNDDGPLIIMLHHPPIQTGICFMDAIGLENADALGAVLEGSNRDVTVIAGHVHGVHHGKIGGHVVATAPAICSGFALDRRDNATVGFLKGPTGCAVIDTGPGGIWSAVSLDPFDGPFSF
ncbi:metallophosphoesterase [Roseovarius phycicola]|uniref:Metallophosphoesterase n=1 Tax=Roseovarius phycicola TaxID=3080976 RepID=A0ABZ2HIY3_9RHOB